MRKFIYAVGMDTDTFQPILKIRQKNEQGSVVELFSGRLEAHPLAGKYSTEEIAKIDTVNKLLEEKMTVEEMDYLVDPLGLKELEKKTPEPSDIQRLAGFKVEKKIIPV